MKYLKTYEDRWYQNKSNTGKIIKRKTIDDRSYNLFLLTNINLDNNEIMVLPIGYCSLDFNYIYLNLLKDAYVYEIDNWFKNEYSLLTNEEHNKLMIKIINYNESYYFEKIKKLTNIDLRDYPIKKDANKYNL